MTVDLDRDVVTVDPVFLMYAFRYALGRQSYAVGDVAAALIANREVLRDDWRAQIVRDIDDALREGRAGASIDRQKWHAVREAMAK